MVLDNCLTELNKNLNYQLDKKEYKSLHPYFKVSPYIKLDRETYEYLLKDNFKKIDKLEEDGTIVFFQVGNGYYGLAYYENENIKIYSDDPRTIKTRKLKEQFKQMIVSLWKLKY
jgi:hypothetical protein